jgi:hypothetical protein
MVRFEPSRPALPNVAMVVHARPGATKEHSMMDVLMLALALGFFALAIGYTYACERL